jgi:serine protease Do
MDQLVSYGRVHRGRLGVTVQGVTNDLAAGLGLSKAEGALVSDVTPGGAADKAGIKRGDVILSYQGRTVVDTNTFRNEIAATKPGTTIALEVMRDGRAIGVKATLTEMEPSAEGGRGGEGAAGEGSGKFGLAVEPLTPEIARQLKLDRDVKGVVITGVDPAGAAAAANLREGDVILQVNGKAVRTAEEVRSALTAVGEKPAVLLIARGSATIFVPLRAR